MPDAAPIASPIRLPDQALPVWICEDPASRSLLQLTHKVAAAASTVLIRGESGTGKDLLAELIHFLSPARHEPFVKIDCASLPSELMESELFGYEKGAFTGAGQTKPGRLEMAGEGTLVLDEIAALTLPLQAKLLRVIEERSFERLGGHATIRIRARLLTLTNVDLEKAVARRTFREDLFYRLYVLPILIPPLRERRGDILPMAEYFLRSLGERHRRNVRLLEDAREGLLAYGFQGNVRELKNLLERAMIWSNREEIALADFPPYMAHAIGRVRLDKTLEEIEREHIAAMLHRYRGKKAKTAVVLGISRKTLLEKRKKYQLD